MRQKPGLSFQKFALDPNQELPEQFQKDIFDRIPEEFNERTSGKLKGEISAHTLERTPEGAFGKIHQNPCKNTWIEISGSWEEYLEWFLEICLKIVRKTLGGNPSSEQLFE